MNIKIALCSLNPTVGDIEGNSELIIEAYQQAVAEGAEIVLTPEMSLTGYPLEDLTLKPAFITADGRQAASVRPDRRTRP